MRAHRPLGFTLVEVLLTVVILASVAAMTGLFASTSMGRGAAGTIPFNDEIILRNAMENINIYYRAQIAADTMTLTGMATYVNGHYPELVNDASTGYVSFSDTDGDKSYTPSSITDTYASGLSLLVTLTKNGQSLATLYTE